MITEKESKLAKMKVAFPTIKQMNERQRCKEFTQEKKDFPDNHPKKKLSTKPKEGEGNFEQELFVISGSETAKKLQAILEKSAKFPSAPSSKPMDGIQASSIPASPNRTKLWDTISKGGTDTTKQKTNEMIHPIGTIVRHKFGNHYFEGEITAYDSKEGFYHVVYLDGDQEDMDDSEVNQYKKPIQQYSRRLHGRNRCHQLHP